MTRKKMKAIALISVVAFVLLLVGCTDKSTPLDENPPAVESVAEPTAEQIQSDLDTAPLASIESDLDSLVLE